uniref:BPTI/Kunitz inhibitor domain-containing protein n=1 Tax=Haemonchus contortus TaxID=6289 RepID=A0A7I4Y105_HAECO
MWLLYLALTVSCAGFSSEQAHVPENTFETCTTKLDRGDACCAMPNNSIRFFFDPELERCFTYLYEGCGGGRNTFYTESQCRNTCIPADKFTCGGNKKPTGTCSDRDMRCPFGSTCVIGALGVGLCCDSANERQWEYEIRQPPCRIGKILKRTVSHGEEVWIGKSCAHRFCPYGYECVQGRRVAHCCGPVPNFKERLYIEDDSFIKRNTYSRPRKARHVPQMRLPVGQLNEYRRRYYNKL